MGRQVAFETTSWSLILAAAASDQGTAADALSQFCSRYWSPIYAFVTGQGYRREDAEDLTQGFLHTVVAGNFLDRADRDRGRFRSYLLAALTNFMANERDRQLARKRGGGTQRIDIASVPEAAAVASPAHQPDRLFQRRWAVLVLQRAIEKVVADVSRREGRTRIDMLLPFLSAVDAPPQYREIASALNTTEGSVRVAVHRLRSRFRDELRREIADTVAAPEQVDDEIRFLISAVSES